jgi:predicted PurR-regulated permease PerM
MARYPTRFQTRTMWNAVSGISMLVLGALIVGLIWLIGQIIGFLQPVVVPLAVAAIIAYLLDPLVRMIQRRGFSRRWAVVSVFAAFTLIVSGLIAITIPLIGGQIHKFKQDQREAATAAAHSTTSTDVPAEEAAKMPIDEFIVFHLFQARNKNEWAKPFIDPLLDRPASATAGAEIVPSDPKAPAPLTITEKLDAAQKAQKPGDPQPVVFADTQLWAQAKGYIDEVMTWAKGGAGKILGFMGLVLGFVMVPIYLYYFLNESAAIAEHWHDYVPLKASRFKTELVETLMEINSYLISFFRGQVIVAFIDGILVGLALTAFHLPLGLLVGVLMAILGIIPYVGNLTVLIPACVLAYFHFSLPANQYWPFGSSPWAYVGGVVAIFLIVQQINSLVTAPKIVGDSVGLHPMTVIFSMLFWSLILGGFVGALLAVPLTAAVKVLFRRYIWERSMKEDPPGPANGHEEWEPSQAEF